jgi:DNA-binding response OmpR family regulator
MSASPAIWILEDDGTLCALLTSRFDGLGWRTTTFHRPRVFEEQLACGAPSLLVLDEMLPERRGVDLLSGLRLQGHRFPVLMLSALHSPEDRIAGLEAGADDYLGKPFSFRELQLRIERLLTSETGGHPAKVPPPAQECFRIGTIHFDALRAQITAADGTMSRISRGDAALLQALVRRPGEVVGRQTLARISGSLVDVSQSRSIDVRLGRLRRLLEDFLQRGDAIEAIRGQGYRLQAPVEAAEPLSTN